MRTDFLVCTVCGQINFMHCQLRFLSIVVLKYTVTMLRKSGVGGHGNLGLLSWKPGVTFGYLSRKPWVAYYESLRLLVTETWGC